ncbi:MAG: thiamine biosynthesis protein, partial [Thaumarchaeota archaeon]|nr:thiamine biosynthesis protein [Nitrososphaerota archaeon]
INSLAANTSKILKIKNQHHNGVRKNEALVVVEAVDPVLASSAVNLLFGIDKIAIAKEVENNFDSVLSTITNTALSLLLKGEKFYVKVEGKTKKFLAKDLEIASTAMLVEKSMHLEAKPGSESNHDRLVYAYLTDTYAYVCIFVDRGLGGIPYNSQKEKILCCIHDELSAIACLQTIKMGFEVKILICYHNESNLLKLVKIVNKILPRIIEENIVLHICKMNGSSGISTTITSITQVMISIASREKIGRISLGISPMIFPASFCEYNASLAFQNKIIPWFSLSGIDSEILENAKEIGLEKYIENLEDLCKKHSNYKKIPISEISKHAKNALKTLKCIQVTAGPKNIHDIIDSLKSNH